MCMSAKLFQLYATLCDLMDCSPPGSSVHEILQAWILEWVAMPSSRPSSQPRDWNCIASHSEEGNGNPLQYCLENPVDRGAWWAADHRVTQSWTRLKRPSVHARIGEGNGSTLQCSCLENPRDRGAWWAAVYGVAQSQTRLSSSSSSRSPALAVRFFTTSAT